MDDAIPRHRLVVCALFLAVALAGSGLVAGGGGAGVPPALRAAPVAIDPLILQSLKWRSVGPEPGTQPRTGDATRGRGGRSIAVSGVKGRPNEGYFGAVGGGLWKTTDGGETWTPVTDGQIHSASVGAVAVSEANPDIVYIGMGESCIRGNIMPGDGVYKSTDAGRRGRTSASPTRRSSRRSASTRPTPTSSSSPRSAA